VPSVLSSVVRRRTRSRECSPRSPPTPGSIPNGARCFQASWPQATTQTPAHRSRTCEGSPSLHRQTATLIVVDDVCLMRRWVAQPLVDLTEMCQRMDSGLVGALERLRKVLREALVGRRMPTCWTHGHYTPGNVRLSGRGSVIGIDDWDWARPAQLALVDEYLMILTASSLVEQVELGTVIAARLKAGGLSDRERNAMRATHDRPSAYSEDGENLDERAAVPLTWLHFAAEQSRKRANYSNVSSWWAAEVAPVLQTVAELPEPADDRRARWRHRPACIDHGRRLEMHC
jgi:hypothetical protein